MRGARPDVKCTLDKITPLEKARLNKNQKLVDVLARTEPAAEASSSYTEAVDSKHSRPLISILIRLTDRAHEQGKKFVPPAPKDIKAVVEADGQAGVLTSLGPSLPCSAYKRSARTGGRRCGRDSLLSVRGSAATCAAVTKVYYLAVVTGNIEGCGVDANVMVTLCGEQAMSGVVMLQVPCSPMHARQG